MNRFSGFYHSGCGFVCGVRVVVDRSATCRKFLHNDPLGKKNQALNFANGVWAVCGAVVWVLFILMMVLSAFMPA